MAHCLLRYREARELERDGLTPDCRTHQHVPAEVARELEGSGTHRWVIDPSDDGQRKCRIVPCEAKEWTKAPSQGFSVMQMKRIFRSKRPSYANVGVSDGATG